MDRNVNDMREITTDRYDKSLENCGQDSDCNGIDLQQLQRVYSCKDDVAILDLQVRADNCLRRAGISSVGELAVRFGEIGRIRGCGNTTVAEIREKLLMFIEHYAPDAEKAGSTATTTVKIRPIRHCIIMQGNAPRYLTCFGGNCLDLCKADKVMAFDGAEYSLGQYRVRVPYVGRPMLFIDGEVTPAVMSRM